MKMVFSGFENYDGVEMAAVNIRTELTVSGIGLSEDFMAAVDRYKTMFAYD